MSSTTTKTALPDLGTDSFDSGAVLYQGGLYPGGTNTVPSTFNTAALAAAASVIPLDASGNSDPSNGIIGVTSIGFSNVRDKWTGVNGGNGFKQLSDADGTRASKVVIYNCAQDTITSDAWADPTNACWTTARSNVTGAGGSLAQVQVVWLEMAKGVSGQSPSFESHLATLKTKFDLIIANIVRAENFPNVKLVFVGGRTYGGYAAVSSLNPEPYAYCTWFGMQYLVAEQVATPARVPFVAWAPFIWANGLTANGSACGLTSGLTWDTSEFQSDHTHPTGAMETKVGNILLTFFQTSDYTRWYNGRSAVAGNYNQTLNYNSGTISYNGGAPVSHATGAATSTDFTHNLNRLAGTTGLEDSAAANRWAGTTGLELKRAVNVACGTTNLEIEAALNIKAGTVGLAAEAALERI